jgi:hypothetical protein
MKPGGSLRFWKIIGTNGWFSLILIFQIPGAGTSLILILFFNFFFKYLEHDGCFILIFNQISRTSGSLKCQIPDPSSRTLEKKIKWCTSRIMNSKMCTQILGSLL